MKVKMNNVNMMEEADWVVLRLLRNFVRERAGFKQNITYTHDLHRALQYLVRKYGDKNLDQSVALLVDEEKIK